MPARTARPLALVAAVAIASLPGCRLARRVKNAIVPPTTNAPPPAPLHATQIALGNTHTCALIDDGTVRCWGGNELGQLGGATNDSTDRPTEVPGVEDAVQIAAGADRTCALSRDGTVRCWGADWDTLEDGRLSPNMLIDPTPVTRLAGLASLVLYHRRTCGVTADRGVLCTRASEFLGIDPTGADGGVYDAAVPEAPRTDADTMPAPPTSVVRVPALTGVVQLAMGDTHSCARIDDGTVRCWGNNQRGQVAADPVRLTIATPSRVPSLEGVRDLAAAGSYTCAIVADGAVECWGSNPPGLGARAHAEADFFRAPTRIPGLTGAVELALAPHHACVRLGDGTVRCWGDNDHGQLGDGTTAHRDAPTPVTGLSNAVEIDAAVGHTCARLADGSLRCWGRNAEGEIGDDSRMDRATPVPVLLQP